MKLAAIDIGSNAIRLQVSTVKDWETKKVKSLEYIRFPLRLGKDVFNTGEITPPTEEKFVKLMIAFKQFLELYEVKDYMVCATSAMREAHNGQQIANRVYYAHGVRIQIIDGNEEGNMIVNAIGDLIGDQLSLHVDVGGGSTEISLLKNKERIAVKSFRMGSVRQLDDEKKERNFEKIALWLERYLPPYYDELKAVGTGGNIKKLYELSKTHSKRSIDITELSSISHKVASMSYEERVKDLGLNPDRADVIVPASEIYLRIFKMAGVQQVLVPDIGLKDGIIKTLMRKHSNTING